MEPPRFAALVGLGFGDCGKGLFTDALCRRWPVHTVARFNGGAQAGHNVVLADGRHHTFSQFGAGSFVPGVHTLLSAPVVVHPTALLAEHTALQMAGVADGWSRLLIDHRCRVTTPYHQAAGRLREWLRRGSPHGSCGAGVGETVRHGLEHPEQVLRYGDLLHPHRALDKLLAGQRALAAAFDLPGLARSGVEDWATEARALADETLARRWLLVARDVARWAPPRSADAIGSRLAAPGTVLFEGAQGALLDEWHGFHPHTTWSSIGPAAADAVLADAGVQGRAWRIGVMRSYVTRHGAGPLPTHDPALDALAEPHNAAGGWQGAFRRGHPDAVLWRYALEALAGVDGLAISHLDAPSKVGLHWCENYEAEVQPGESTLCHRGADGRVSRLLPGAAGDLSHQSALTRLLLSARPCLEARAVASQGDWLARVESTLGCKAVWTADGPTSEHVRQAS